MEKLLVDYNYLIEDDPSNKKTFVEIMKKIFVLQKKYTQINSKICSGMKNIINIINVENVENIKVFQVLEILNTYKSYINVTIREIISDCDIMEQYEIQINNYSGKVLQEVNINKGRSLCTRTKLMVISIRDHLSSILEKLKIIESEIKTILETEQINICNII